MAVGGEGRLIPISDHNYNRAQKNISRGSDGSGPRQFRAPAPQLHTTSYPRQYKFTPGQLQELGRVFEETHYPIPKVCMGLPQ